MLWAVLATLSNDDMARFVAFAWGRKRLPPEVQTTHQMNILPTLQ